MFGPTAGEEQRQSYTSSSQFPVSLHLQSVVVKSLLNLVALWKMMI